MDVTGERQQKVTLGMALKAMKDSTGYKAVMDRVAERCGSGKWWRGWVVADEAKAKAMRELARGYIAFDELVDQMIFEGETAKKALEAPQKGDDLLSSPRTRFDALPGQGEEHA